MAGSNYAKGSRQFDLDKALNRCDLVFKRQEEGKDIFE
jgi:hypothetical protein